MRVRRRSLRKALVVVGCVFGAVALPAAGIGMGLILLGAGLHLWSKGCLEQNRRLTTAGPYRWTRNPFYLANGLIDVGLCFVIGRLWVPWVFLPIWWIAYRDTIELEEERLSELFPDEFAAYQTQVPMLIPTGKSWPAERANGEFSFRNDGLARGAEYARLLGIFIAPYAIWVADRVRDLGLSILDGKHDEVLVLVMALPTLWIWKLALGETFRRPDLRLFPGASVGHNRLIFLIGLVVIAGVLLYAKPWVAILPMTWLGVLLLDDVGEARSQRQNLERLETWSYFPRMLAASLVGFGIIWMLGPLVS